ncbi:MAG: formyltransferase family protein [Thermoanaerobaculia bacterium]
MKIAFFAADDPLYLPDFFRRVLDERGSDTIAVYLTPPLYRNQTRLAAAWRYLRTFGPGATVRLIGRLLRSRRERRSIAAVCRDHGVAVETISDVNAPEFLERLRSQAPDLVISVSCPQLFRRPLIEVPSRGLLNIHGSILPAYRGVLPAFWMLANGERRAGVTVFLVNEGIDTGDVCGQEVFEILPEESLDQFLRRSKAFAAELLLKVITAFEGGTARPARLDLTQGSYHSWPDRDAVARFRATGRRLW